MDGVADGHLPFMEYLRDAWGFQFREYYDMMHECTLKNWFYDTNHEEKQAAAEWTADKFVTSFGLKPTIRDRSKDAEE